LKQFTWLDSSGISVQTCDTRARWFLWRFILCFSARIRRLCSSSNCS